MTYTPNYGLPYDWIPIAELPPPGDRPGRVFVLVEGEKHHSGKFWLRQFAGIAATWNEGFDPIDIDHIESRGDMDAGTGLVTHWLPIMLPNFPRRPLTTEEADCTAGIKTTEG